MNLKRCFRTLDLLLFRGRVPKLLVQLLPSQSGDMEPLLARLMLRFLRRGDLPPALSPSLGRKQSSSTLDWRLRLSAPESSKAPLWEKLSSLPSVMELSRLRELLSLEKRGFLGQRGAAVPQPPGHGSSSSGVPSRAVSVTSPASRSHRGQLFTSIFSGPASRTAEPWWQREIPCHGGTGTRHAMVAQGNIMLCWHRDTPCRAGTGTHHVVLAQGRATLWWHRDTSCGGGTGTHHAVVAQGHAMPWWHRDTPCPASQYREQPRILLGSWSRLWVLSNPLPPHTCRVKAASWPPIGKHTCKQNSALLK